MTHTVALLGVSRATIEDVTARIERVNYHGDYDRMFKPGPDGKPMIDMTGVGLVEDVTAPHPTHFIENVLRYAEEHGKTRITMSVSDLQKVIDKSISDTTAIEVSYE